MAHKRVSNDVEQNEMKKNGIKNWMLTEQRKWTKVALKALSSPKGILFLSILLTYHHRTYSLGLIHRIIILEIQLS